MMVGAHHDHFGRTGRTAVTTIPAAIVERTGRRAAMSGSVPIGRENSENNLNKESTMRKIITAPIVVAVALLTAISLAGCAGDQAGTAVIAPGAPVTVTSTESPPLSTAAPAPTVTATVLVQPPVTVVQPQAPVTVIQPPVTVYPDSPSIADLQVARDHSIAESTIGWWIPQLSSKTDGAGAMSRFYSLQANYPDVFMVWSGDYSSFRSPNYYVALVPREYGTSAAANAWCDFQGFSADNCFAKRLSHNDGPDGNSAER